MKTLLTLTLLVLVSFVMAKENKSPAAEAVNGACQEEAKVANCGDKKVGTGLLKCIHAYKKEHHDFALSEGCKGAMKENRVSHKARKNK